MRRARPPPTVSNSKSNVSKEGGEETYSLWAPIPNKKNQENFCVEPFKNLYSTKRIIKSAVDTYLIFKSDFHFNFHYNFFSSQSGPESGEGETGRDKERRQMDGRARKIGILLGGQGRECESESLIRIFPRSHFCLPHMRVIESCELHSVPVIWSGLFGSLVNSWSIRSGPCFLPSLPS